MGKNLCYFVNLFFLLLSLTESNPALGWDLPLSGSTIGQDSTTVTVRLTERMPSTAPNTAAAAAAPAAPTTAVAAGAAESAPGNTCEGLKAAITDDLVDGGKPSPEEIACKTQATNCLNTVTIASMACLSTTSPQWVGLIIPAMSAVLELKQMTASPQEMCSKGEKLLTSLSGALTAYNLACGADQLVCNNSCEAAAKTCAGAESTFTAASAQACVQKCGSYKVGLAIGAAGALEFLKTAMTANNCSNKLDCTNPINYTNAACTANCSLAQNQNSPACVCQVNPNAAGCTAAYSASSTSLGNGTVGGLGNPVTTAAIKAKGALNESGPLVPGTGGASAPSTAGAGSGSGGGGGGSSGQASAGGGSPSHATGADKASSPSDLYAGLMSAGGSVARTGGGYGNDSDGSGGAGSKYSMFMPNKANARTPAASSELTGSGGQTNWQKVRRTYTDLNTTLINGPR